MDSFNLFFLLLLGHIKALRLPPLTSVSRPGLWHRIDDMVLSPNQIEFLYDKYHPGKNVIVMKTFRWSNGTVPYEFSDEFTESQKEFVVKVLKEQFEKTCVVFRPREETDEDYVRVVSKGGCFSHVGRIGKMQIISLNKKVCMNKRNIAHEFLHALGLYHQQASSNRDDYLTIKWENIKSAHVKNFEKYQPDRVTDFGLPYDYDSIMHYAKNAFSINGKPTIIPKKENVNLEVATSLSAIDIIKVNKMYKCEEK